MVIVVKTSLTLAAQGLGRYHEDFTDGNSFKRDGLKPLQHNGFSDYHEISLRIPKWEQLL